MSGPNETFDISAKQKRILEARAARRNILRVEYLKQIGNPYRMATGEGGTVFDSGLQRFLSMNATSGQFYRPNTKNSIFYICTMVLPCALAMYFFGEAKDAQENMYRTGQVSYRDRQFKFF